MITWTWRLLSRAFAPKWLQLTIWSMILIPVWLGLLFAWTDLIYEIAKWAGSSEAGATFLALFCWFVGVIGSVIAFFGELLDRISRWYKS